MLDELYAKGGLNFMTTDEQIGLGKKILRADTFDTFNELPFNTKTRIDEHYSLTGNPFTPQTIQTKGLSQLRKDAAVAKQNGYSTAPLAENGDATFSMKVTPELIEEYFRDVIAPNQSLLYDERGTLDKLKATVGIDAQRGLTRIPMADSSADRILEQVRLLQTVNEVLRNRGGPGDGGVNFAAGGPGGGGGGPPPPAAGGGAGGGGLAAVGGMGPLVRAARPGGGGGGGPGGGGVLFNPAAGGLPAGAAAAAQQQQLQAIQQLQQHNAQQAIQLQNNFGLFTQTLNQMNNTLQALPNQFNNMAQQIVAGGNANANNNTQLLTAINQNLLMQARPIAPSQVMNSNTLNQQQNNTTNNNLVMIGANARAQYQQQQQQAQQPPSFGTSAIMQQAISGTQQQPSSVQGNVSQLQIMPSQQQLQIMPAQAQLQIMPGPNVSVAAPASQPIALPQQVPQVIPLPYVAPQAQPVIVQPQPLAQPNVPVVAQPPSIIKPTYRTSQKRTKSQSSRSQNEALMITGTKSNQNIFIPQMPDPSNAAGAPVNPRPTLPLVQSQQQPSSSASQQQQQSSQLAQSQMLPSAPVSSGQVQPNPVAQAQLLIPQAQVNLNPGVVQGSQREMNFRQYHPRLSVEEQKSIALAHGAPSTLLKRQIQSQKQFDQSDMRGFVNSTFNRGFLDFTNLARVNPRQNFIQMALEVVAGVDLNAISDEQEDALRQISHAFLVQIPGIEGITVFDPTIGQIEIHQQIDQIFTVKFHADYIKHLYDVGLIYIDHLSVLLPNAFLGIRGMSDDMQQLVFAALTAIFNESTTPLLSMIISRYVEEYNTHVDLGPLANGSGNLEAIYNNFFINVYIPYSQAMDNFFIQTTSVVTMYDQRAQTEIQNFVTAVNQMSVVERFNAVDQLMASFFIGTRAQHVPVLLQVSLTPDMRDRFVDRRVDLVNSRDWYPSRNLSIAGQVDPRIYYIPYAFRNERKRSVQKEEEKKSDQSQQQQTLQLTPQELMMMSTPPINDNMYGPAGIQLNKKGGGGPGGGGIGPTMVAQPSTTSRPFQQTETSTERARREENERILKEVDDMVARQQQQAAINASTQQVQDRIAEQARLFDAATQKKTSRAKLIGKIKGKKKGGGKPKRTKLRLQLDASEPADVRMVDQFTSGGSSSEYLSARTQTESSAAATGESNDSDAPLADRNKKNFDFGVGATLGQRAKPIGKARRGVSKLNKSVIRRGKSVAKPLTSKTKTKPPVVTQQFSPTASVAPYVPPPTVEPSKPKMSQMEMDQLIALNMPSSGSGSSGRRRRDFKKTDKSTVRTILDMGKQFGGSLGRNIGNLIGLGGTGSNMQNPADLSMDASVSARAVEQAFRNQNKKGGKKVQSFYPQSPKAPAMIKDGTKDQKKKEAEEKRKGEYSPLVFKKRKK